MIDYVNDVYSKDIVCPYCGKAYEPTYEDTFIGDDIADCYTEDTKEYTCTVCGKRFKMTGVLNWEYYTETIEGESEEAE